MEKALIVGSMTEEFFSSMESSSIETEYGEVEYLTTKDGIFVIPRHRIGHTLSPNAINYRANVKALEKLGVKYVITTHAVGSISQKLVPTEIGIIGDYINFTSSRPSSFFDGEGKVKHTEMVFPFSKEMRAMFLKKAFDEKITLRTNLVYITTNGPFFESPAEIRAFRSWGADVVGMTLNPEINLIHELSINALSVAFSVNWASGLDEEGLGFIEKESRDRLMRRVVSLSLGTLEAI